MATLLPYTPPSWARGLRNIPKYRVQLAHADTPIQPWLLGGLPPGYSVSIKRDDLTGSVLSGNKVRKLEFLMAEALAGGYKHVITCGSTESNHCRATSLCARQLGLEPHLACAPARPNEFDKSFVGNGLLFQLSGANVYLEESTPTPSDMESFKEKIEKDTGESIYSIPIGGSNHTGVFGYVQCFEELRQQGVLEDFTDIVVAFGTGGTVAGLALGNYLTGCHLKIHACTISDVRVGLLHKHLEEAFQEAGLGAVDFSDWVLEYEQYLGRGYALSTPQELEFIAQTCMETGIALDPVYTGKAAYGMMDQLRSGTGNFRGNRLLFIHTGGMFTLYDGRMPEVLRKPGAPWNKEWCRAQNCKF